MRIPRGLARLPLDLHVPILRHLPFVGQGHDVEFFSVFLCLRLVPVGVASVFAGFSVGF